MAEVKKFLTPPFRANFTNTLFEAESMDGGPLKYGVMAIWYPGRFTKSHQKLWDAIMAELDSVCMLAFKKKWGDLPGNFKKGIRDGSEKQQQPGDCYDGAVFANLTTKLRPGVVDIAKDAAGKPIAISKEAGNTDAIYSGCWMRATATIYTYDNKGKGVALGLMNAQKLAEGSRLDNRGNAAADFADQEEDADFLAEVESEVDDEIPF